MQISATTMERSMEISQKNKDRTAIWSSDTAAGHISKGMYTIATQLYTDAHHNSIHNSQVMETSQMPYNWWMGQENVVYINKGVLISHKE
jgi:hypothetical protein